MAQQAFLIVGAFAVFGLALFSFLAATGVTAAESARAGTLVALGSFGAGLTWGLVRGRRVDVIELIAVGIALYSVCAALVSALAAGRGWIAPGWLLVAILSVLPSAWWAARQLSGRPSFTPTARMATTLPTFAGVAALLLVSRATLGDLAVGEAADFSKYHGDVFFFESLSHVLANFGSGESGLMAGWPLRYHWLVYSFAGATASDAGLTQFVGVLRVLPVVAAFSLAATAAAWSGSLSRSRWVPSAAVALLLLGASIGSSGNRVINWISPSQSVGAAWLLALLLVTTAYVRRTDRSLVPVVIAALAVGCAAGKSSSAGVALGATGAVMAWTFLAGSRDRRRAVLAFAIVALAFVAVYVLVTSGSATNGGLGPSALVQRVIGRPTELGAPFAAATAALTILLAVLPRWVGLLVVATDGRVRKGLGLEIAVGIGAAGVAVAAVLLLDGVDSNQLWFVDAACAPLAVLTAVAVERAWRRLLLPRTTAWWSAAVVLVVATGWASVAVAVGRSEDATSYPFGLPLPLVLVSSWLLGALGLSATLALLLRLVRPVPLLRAFTAIGGAFLAAASVGFGVVSATTLQEEANPPSRDIDVGPLVPAATWLRDHADPGDVVATADDSRGVVPAISGLRPYADWERYSGILTRVGGAAEFTRRQSVARAVAEGSTEDSALCSDGVTWLVAPTDSVSPQLQDAVAYRDVAFAVLRLRC